MTREELEQAVAVVLRRAYGDNFNVTPGSHWRAVAHEALAMCERVAIEHRERAWKHAGHKCETAEAYVPIDLTPALEEKP